ncbi:MAG TPA: uracil-DNA glycosylase [Rhizomicrobium sp.]
MPAANLEPPHDCPLCPRLADFRAANRKKFPDYFNAPVPCFGPRDARLAIAGLAPGLHGANATGRPFTGDWAGDLLYATLLKHGLARGVYKERADDGLELVDCRIVNSVRCVPPQNKPELSEIKTCRQFLIAEIGAMPKLRAILALGKIAHDSVCDTLGLRKAAHPFKHGGVYQAREGLKLVSSYHCSRYNTNTGRLTAKMFEDVVGLAKKLAQ